MPQLFLSQKHFDLLMTYFQCKNMDDLRQKLEDGYKPESAKLSLKDQKLMQEIINLKIKNRLSLIHDMKATTDIAIEITNGTRAIETIFQNEKKKFCLTWVGTKLICDGCGHEHFNHGQKTCQKLECHCMINEVEL